MVCSDTRLGVEVLYALANGVRVFGASSMGALRAAELHAFGMESRRRLVYASRRV